MGDILEESIDHGTDVAINGDSDDHPVTSNESGEKETEVQKAEQTEEVIRRPKLASYILSASVGGNEEPVQLPEPISFTMKHIKVSAGNPETHEDRL